MSQEIVVQIVKQKYSPPGRDSYFAAEVSLLTRAEKELIGSSRLFETFEAAAHLLRRETGITHEDLQRAFVIFESGRPARIVLKLEDEQIGNMGFRPPESET